MVALDGAGGLRCEPSTDAQDFGEGPFEFPTGAGVNERIQRAVAVAQPETAAEQRLRHTRRTQSSY